MTDGLNSVSYSDRAAITDTNHNKLDLAFPQFFTATRLDQLVYRPNCYIQTFILNFFPRSGDWTSNSSKLKSNALPIALLSYITHMVALGSMKLSVNKEIALGIWWLH